MSAQVELFKGLPEEEQALAMSLLFQRKLNQPPAAAPVYVDLVSFFREPRPPREYLVEGLLGRGHLAMLGGRPKSGKSWLALQLVRAVDEGLPFLGRRALPGRVLYAPLEDGPDRLHERAQALGWDARQSKAVFKLPPLNTASGDPGPGLESLEAAAADFDLIIIDTLSMLLSGRVSENDNAAMGSIVNEVAAIAHNAGCAILLVHHAGKGMSDDVFNLLRGASALRGAYDVGLLMDRKPGEREAVLHIEARDFEGGGLTIRQRAGGNGWDVVGEAKERERIRAGRRVVDALSEFEDGATAEELAELLAVSKAAISKQLRAAERDGHVVVVRMDSQPPGRPKTVWGLASAGNPERVIKPYLIPPSPEKG